VGDVQAFPGHIACDAETRSEIVVPMFGRRGLKDGHVGRIGEIEREKKEDKERKGKVVVAILDLDCRELRGFDEVDREGLERLAGLLGRGSVW
jgi:L-methionine (R)-S-oxide reductase